MAKDSGAPQTVTQFAVQQGLVEKDASVQAAIDGEQERAKANTERAERTSAILAPDSAGVQDNDGE